MIFGEILKIPPPLFSIDRQYLLLPILMYFDSFWLMMSIALVMLPLLMFNIWTCPIMVFLSEFEVMNPPFLAINFEMDDAAAIMDGSSTQYGTI